MSIATTCYNALDLDVGFRVRIDALPGGTLNPGALIRLPGLDASRRERGLDFTLANVNPVTTEALGGWYWGINPSRRTNPTTKSYSSVGPTTVVTPGWPNHVAASVGTWQTHRVVYTLRQQRSSGGPKETATWYVDGSAVWSASADTPALAASAFSFSPSSPNYSYNGFLDIVYPGLSVVPGTPGTVQLPSGEVCYIHGTVPPPFIQQGPGPAGMAFEGDVFSGDVAAAIAAGYVTGFSSATGPTLLFLGAQAYVNLGVALTISRLQVAVNGVTRQCYGAKAREFTPSGVWGHDGEGGGGYTMSGGSLTATLQAYRRAVETAEGLALSCVSPATGSTSTTLAAGRTSALLGGIGAAGGVHQTATVVPGGNPVSQFLWAWPCHQTDDTWAAAPYWQYLPDAAKHWPEVSDIRSLPAYTGPLALTGYGQALAARTRLADTGESAFDLNGFPSTYSADPPQVGTEGGAHGIPAGAYGIVVDKSGEWVSTGPQVQFGSIGGGGTRVAPPADGFVYADASRALAGTQPGVPYIDSGFGYQQNGGTFPGDACPRLTDFGIVRDPVTDETGLVGIRETWSGTGDSASRVTELVWQALSERIPNGTGYDLPAAVVLATLPALSDPYVGYMFAHAVIDRLGRLWCALWRVGHDGTMSAVVYTAAPGATSATLGFMTPGVTRPPRNVALLTTDPVLDETALWMIDPAAQGLVSYPAREDGGVSSGRALALPAFNPPYGAWLSGTAPFYDLCSATIVGTGAYRFRLMAHGYYDSRGTFGGGYDPAADTGYGYSASPARVAVNATMYGVWAMTDLLDAACAVDPATGVATVTMEAPL